MKQTQKPKFISTSIISIIILTILFFIYNFITFLQTPLTPPNKNINYIFVPHGSVRTLANDLNQLGILQHPNQLIFLSYLNGTFKHLQAGEYLFHAGILPNQLLQQIAKGQVVIHQITLIEGWNIWQVMTALNNAPRLTHLLTNVPANEIMAVLAKSKSADLKFCKIIPTQYPEGLFFPSTYSYTMGTSDETLLLTAYRIMQNYLQTEWVLRDPTVPYQTPYQSLIAASIIEKEAKLNSERAMISGVILRRLQKPMNLEMDATVIYGLGSQFVEPLTHDDMHKDTPYNTYLHAGLPSTPIAMPSLASIRAALHPAPGDYLYYVAKGDGSHEFSVTYAQQLKAIAKYEK